MYSEKKIKKLIVLDGYKFNFKMFLNNNLKYYNDKTLFMF